MAVEGKPRALRAVARCSSLEEFVNGFARFAERERLFVVTSDPKAPGGPPQPFVIQLADGSTALKGVGEVVEQHLIPTGPEGKCGMWLRLVDLTPASREVHQRLLERRERLSVMAPKPIAPPPAPVPRPPTLPARTPAPTMKGQAIIPRIAAPRPSKVPDATPLPQRAPTREELLEKAHRLAGPSPFREERVPPSPFQLPANPLADVNDESLGHFVECMIYENSEVVDVDSFAEPTDVQLVAFDPTAGLAPISLAPPVAVAMPSVVAQGSPEVNAVPLEPPVMAMPVMQPPPFYVPPVERSRKLLVIVAVASVVIGVVGGWMIFGGERGGGGGGEEKKAATAAAPATAAAAAAAPAPALAPAAAPATAPATAAAPATAPVAAPATAPAAAPAAAPATATATATATVAATVTAAKTGCMANVTSVPAEADVRWGGTVLGQTPLSGVAVPCGESQVIIDHPRYVEVARPMTVAAGAAAALDVKLVRPKVALTLRSIPPGASFEIDGAALGRGPVTAKVLGFETLHVSASLAGYATWHGTIKVQRATGVLFARMARAK